MHRLKACATARIFTPAYYELRGEFARAGGNRAFARAALWARTVLLVLDCARLALTDFVRHKAARRRERALAALAHAKRKPSLEEAIMGVFWQDVKYGIRMAAKSPGLTIAAILSLALGIGANSTVFTWAQAIMFHPLPGVPEQSRIVSMSTSWQDGKQCCGGSSYPDYRDYRDRNTTLQGLLASDMAGVSLTHDGRAERAWALTVTGNYFDVLRLRPAAGRFFLPEEDRTPGTHPVVVLSHAFWQRRFGGDPGILNQNITINEKPFTVIGVAPEKFQGTEVAIGLDLFMPMAMV
ncbi:MAG: ABC transporter permease, partial [Candidatus Acidiferrales bacterium]